MRLGTSTNIYFNRPDGGKAPIESSMALCAGAGYRVMDLNFHDCTTFRLPFVTDGWERWLFGLCQLAEDLGVTFSQAHAPFYNFCDPGDPKREEVDRLLPRAIDCCAGLGIPWLVIHAGTDWSAQRPRRASKEKNLAYFRPVVDYALRRGVGIAFENLWDLTISPRRRYTADAEELLDFVESFGCKDLGVCWDTDHAALMGQDQRQGLALLGPWLRCTHISDCLDPRADHLLPYHGTIDWDPVLDGLALAGYQGDFTYEIHRYTQALPDALVPEALAYSVSVGKHLLARAKERKMMTP